MAWFIYAVLAQLLGAVSVLLDKFILGSKRIASPATYTFFVGVFGLGVLVLWPLSFWSGKFALAILDPRGIVISLLSGLSFVAGMFYFYSAVQKSRVSKVTPIVFSAVPLVSFVLAFAFGSERLGFDQIVGAMFLVGGGILVALDFPLTKGERKLFRGFEFSLAAGFFLAVHFLLFKELSVSGQFFNNFAWTRFAIFASALMMLLKEDWRALILGSFHHGRKNKRESLKTGSLFVLNKVTGGTSSVLLNVAISLGSVTLVNSMTSLQFLFVFIFSYLIAVFMPGHKDFFEEDFDFWEGFFKVWGILLIGIGLLLI